MDPVFLGCSGKDYLMKNINDAFLMVDILTENHAIHMKRSTIVLPHYLFSFLCINFMFISVYVSSPSKFSISGSFLIGWEQGVCGGNY